MDRFQEVLHMNRNKIQEYLGRHVVFRYVLRRLVSLIPILPDGVRLASNQEKIAAAIKVQKRPTKTIKVDVGDILLDGLAEGKNVEFEDETVTLTIYADEDLADVEASQFVLHLDCGTLKENEFTEAELTVDIDESLQDLNITAGIPAVSAKLIVE